MRVPIGSIVLGTLGTLFLVRGIWNPHRAVVRKGAVDSCAGPGPGSVCESTIGISVGEDTTVYSVGGGRVLSVGPDWVHIQVSNEPVVLFYSGVDPDVKEGQHVWRGQRLGTASGFLDFGVYELVKTNGGAELRAVEPASWLAARGYKIAVSLEGKRDLWCAQGRRISVPKATHQTCGLRPPAAAGFALLPVSISEE